jgi:hypothetical protein
MVNDTKTEFIDDAKARMTSTYERWCNVANNSLVRYAAGNVERAHTLASIIDKMLKNIKVVTKTRGGDPSDDGEDADEDADESDQLVEFDSDDIRKGAADLAELFIDKGVIIPTGQPGIYKELLINLDVSLLELLPNDTYVLEQITYLIAGLDELSSTNNMDNFSNNYGNVFNFYAKIKKLVDQKNYTPNGILTESIKQVQDKITMNKENRNNQNSINQTVFQPPAIGTKLATVPVATGGSSCNKSNNHKRRTSRKKKRSSQKSVIKHNKSKKHTKSKKHHKSKKHTKSKK